MNADKTTPQRLSSAFICVYLRLILCLSCSGCARYADFTLPGAPGGDPQLNFAFDALPDPVLTRGEGWESTDVRNPSVIRESGGLVNYYSGFDGRTWHTGRALSADGIHWQKQGKLLSPDPSTWENSYIAANGAAVAFEGRIRYWYVAGPKPRPRIGFEGRVALPTGPYGSWDERGVSDPLRGAPRAVFLSLLHGSRPRPETASRRGPLRRRHPLGQTAVQPHSRTGRTRFLR